jgi:glycosyltransferase involved in cell wall biosynthesis
MRIAHLLLTHSFAGTERYVVELANAQAETGHEVSVILHKRSAEPRSNAIAHRFHPSVKKVFVGGPGVFSFWTARRALLKLNIDVAHGHLSAGCRALHGLKGRFLRVATLHIHYKAQQHRDMDALIAIAPWQLTGVPEKQQPRTAQINNWTQASVADSFARKKIREDLGVSDVDFLIGALCRAEASKGLDVLLDAYAISRPVGTRLVIVGGGRDWEALRARASPDVLMPGFVDRPEDWFSALDGYVSAARSEPFGLVFLEAFAAGLPVLSTASQGAQMFQSLIGRPLLPCDDVAAMSNGLKLFATVRPQRKRYDLSGYEHAQQIAKIDAFYVQQLTNKAPD